MVQEQLRCIKTEAKQLRTNNSSLNAIQKYLYFTNVSIFKCTWPHALQTTTMVIKFLGWLDPQKLYT